MICVISQLKSVSLLAMEQVEIPEIMAPYTEIEYISESNYTILNGNEADKNEKIESSIKHELLGDLDIKDSITEPSIKPIKGMRIIYGSGWFDF